MTFFDVLLTIIGALFIGAIFYFIFKSSGPWGSFWSFLVILIMVGLVAEAWIPPVGPVYWDFAWIPTLFVMLIFALLIAAATPPRSTVRESFEKDKVDEEEKATAIALGSFFWVFMILLAIALIASFV